MSLNHFSSTPVATSGNVYVQSLLNAGWRWDTFGTTGDTNTVRWAVDASGWTPAQVQTLTDVFGAWSNVAAITFQQVTNLNDAEIVLHQTLGANIAGFAGYSGTPNQAVNTPTNDPINGIYVGDIGRVHTYVATDGFQIPGQPTFIPDPTNPTGPPIISAAGFELIVHEIGHALGLKHPFDFGTTNFQALFPGIRYVAPNPAATPPVLEQFFSNDLGNNNLNQSLYTLMSYNHWQDVGAAPGTPLAPMATPMAFDIAAIQQIYGANTNYQGGSNTYVLPEPGSAAGMTWQSIWDTGGIDEIVYNGTANAFIDLRPATLDNSPTGGGMPSYTYIGPDSARVYGRGFTIAGDFTNALADQQSETGVVIENASGGSGSDWITGNAADNILNGNGGRDILVGGAGNDILNGGSANDNMRGGAGNDTYFVDDARDVASESTNFLLNRGDAGGVDTVVTTLSSYSLEIRLENLTIGGVTGNYQGTGNALGNIITAVSGPGGLTPLPTYRLSGQGGNDTITGANGADKLIGGSGADILDGGLGDDTLEGGDDADILHGGGGVDTLDGGAGDDVLFGEDGDDVLRGGNGADTLIDFLGVNRMFGEGGDDTITSVTSLGALLDGGQGDDSLFSSGGGNTLVGGGGRDRLENQGSGAPNAFTGGADADLFVYRGGVPLESQTTVTDFRDGIDHIGLTFVQFGQLAITDSAAGAVIRVLDGFSPTMVLTGIAAGQLTQADFLLA